MLKVLDLFSGIGGFSLGLERTGGFETVAFCEIDPFCRKVLAKHWPDVLIYDDVRELRHDGPVDVICGGYPCQPFSHAGKRQGAEDDRHLWPAMLEVIKTHRPTWVIGENVAGHISMGLDEVLSDLEGQDYTCQAFVIPACAVGASHGRDRLWIVSHTNSNKRRQRCAEESISGKQNGEIKFTGMVEGWARRSDIPSPRTCRTSDGIPNLIHRLRSLGNAVVPQIPEAIGNTILEAEGLK